MAMKRLASAIASGSLVLGAVFAPGVRSANGPDPDLAAKAAQFRDTFGFESDPAYVERSLLDTEAFPVDRYGAPLTEAEAAEIQRRISVELDLTDAVEWASTQPEFGGWYMDQSNGGIPVIQVAGDPTAFGKSFAQYVDPGVDYRLVAVKNAQQDLQALEDNIWSDRSELARGGIDLQGVALDIRNNLVRVEVEGLTDKAIQNLVSRYGPSISSRTSRLSRMPATAASTARRRKAASRSSTFSTRRTNARQGSTSSSNPQAPGDSLPPVIAYSRIFRPLATAGATTALRSAPQ